MKMFAHLQNPKETNLKWSFQSMFGLNDLYQKGCQGWYLSTLAALLRFWSYFSYLPLFIQYFTHVYIFQILFLILLYLVILLYLE